MLIRSPKGQERVFLLVRCPAKSAWKSVFRVGKGVLLISGVSCFTGFCVVGVERERGEVERERERREKVGERGKDTETLTQRHCYVRWEGEP